MHEDRTISGRNAVQLSSWELVYIYIYIYMHLYMGTLVPMHEDRKVSRMNDVQLWGLSITKDN